MPQLELLRRHPARGCSRPPLLFVHGAFCAAWVWEEHFLPWFAKRGWDANALSLRGHGGSEGHERLHWHGMSDYVDDLDRAFQSFAQPPILIGHSMGGMVVQRLATRRRPRAIVLMASAPPRGLLETTIGLAWRAPDVFGQMSALFCLGMAWADPTRLRRALFSECMPATEVESYESRFQEESRTVLMELTHWNPLPPSADTTVPTLVLGAENDLLFPPDQVHATARHFNTTPQFIPNMGHTMMLEPDWETVAACIHAWLERQVCGAEQSDAAGAA